MREEKIDVNATWRARLFQLAYLLRLRAQAPRVSYDKSWDVLTMVEAIRAAFPRRDGRILDMGSYNSEIPLALWQDGYRAITALDLNPLGRSIRWYGNAIRFVCGDFYQCPLPDASLDVITALSVVEHGYNEDRLFESCRRMLVRGGLLCLTTDFHYQKIHVPDQVRIFGLPYRIFDRAEIEGLLATAARYGFEPIGPADWGPSSYPIRFLDFQFTFLFAALRKVA